MIENCSCFCANRIPLSIINQKNDITNQKYSMKQSNFEEENTTPSINDIVNNPSVSIGAGVAGIIVLLGNRLAFGDIVSDVQSRADIISGKL